MTAARRTGYCLFFLTLLAVCGTVGLRLRAQPAAPPSPAKYRVQLRYDINAPRDAHVAQYDAMIAHLIAVGFEFIPPLEKHADTDREDPSKNELTGLISSAKALEIFRNRHIVSAVLMPEDYKLPDMADQPVGIRLELTPGLGAAGSRELAEQIRPILQLLGFREAVGYDHRGYTGRPFTRLVGTIPAARVETLLRDLRNEPGGWFAPLLARNTLPAPLRSVSPILVTEVLPAMQPLVEPAAPAKRAKESDEKIAADLWAIASAKERVDIRMQVVLAYAPAPDDTGWQVRLRNAAPKLIIDGWLGQFVTGTAPAAEATGLAALPEVAAVRLARPAQVQIDAGVKINGDNERALRQSGLEALHKKNFRGQGIRLAILDTDFRGWSDALRNKRLPAGTRLVDLTRTLDTYLRPAPYLGADTKIGHGTQCALAAALAAPEAEMVLIRFDAVAPFRLRQVVQYIHGEFLSSDLIARRDEQVLAKAELRHAGEELLKDEKKLQEGFEDYSEMDEEYGYLGAVYGWIFNPRVVHQQRKAYQEHQQQVLEALADEFRKLVDEVKSLKGIQIVSNPLLWNDGYPLGGLSPLSRWFDEPPLRTPLWFQSGGNTHGQAWVGLFRDVDDNGVMEFAPAEAPLPKGLWTRELNVIGWQPYQGQRTAELPANAKLRISMQWREPHDPDYYARAGEEDPYRKPLAAMRLVLLRQVDPEGKKTRADEFEVAGYSYGLPQRLDYTPDYGIYEQAVEVTIAKPGRYSLRVERQRDSRWMLVTDPATDNPLLVKLEGAAPTGIRPVTAPTLTSLEKNWDFKPRLFVDVTDDAARSLGRPVFVGFNTDLGDIGVPADARTVITVGAASLDDKLQPYTAAGPPAGLELFRKPNVFAYDSLQLGPDGTGPAFGSSLSTSFAAGLCASVLSSGMPREEFLKSIEKESGTVLRVPPR